MPYEVEVNGVKVRTDKIEDLPNLIALASGAGAAVGSPVGAAVPDDRPRPAAHPKGLAALKLRPRWTADKVKELLGEMDEKHAPCRKLLRHLTDRPANDPVPMATLYDAMGVRGRTASNVYQYIALTAQKMGLPRPYNRERVNSDWVVNLEENFWKAAKEANM